MYWSFGWVDSRTPPRLTGLPEVVYSTTATEAGHRLLLSLEI